MVSLPLNHCMSQRSGRLNVFDKIWQVHEFPRTVHHFEEEIFRNVSPWVEERRVVSASGISEGAGSLNEPLAHDGLIGVEKEADIEAIVELKRIDALEDQDVEHRNFDHFVDDVVGVMVVDRNRNWFASTDVVEECRDCGGVVALGESLAVSESLFGKGGIGMKKAVTRNDGNV